jgi:hypothetical protein
MSEKYETGSPEVPNPAAEMKCEVAMTSKIPTNRNGDIDKIILNFWISCVNHPENLSVGSLKRNLTW